MTIFDVSIIIVNYNTEKITCDCIKSVLNSKTNFYYEVILVDNNSHDNSVDSIRQLFPNIQIVALSQNLGFSKANNIGIKLSKGKYILLLNSDTLLFSDSLENLVRSAIENKYQIVGPTLLNSDLSIQRSWFNFPSPLKIFLRLTNLYLVFYRFASSYVFKMIYPTRKPAFMVKSYEIDTKMDYLTFAAILIHRNVFDKIGLLDEVLFFYQEDCEYGLRAKKYNIDFVLCVASKIIHLGGSSSSKFSALAFENDILGLLHIYKKHYKSMQFTIVKFIIYLALIFRINFYYLGFYKRFKNSGLYDDINDNKVINKQVLEVYLRMLSVVKSYK